MEVSSFLVPCAIPKYSWESSLRCNAKASWSKSTNSPKSRGGQWIFLAKSSAAEVLPV